jgi:hypothetical protein
MGKEAEVDAICDAEGNETLVHSTTVFSSYIGTNKDMSKVYFTGREDDAAFDQQFFLDNITYIRTTDTSVIPEIPAE